MSSKKSKKSSGKQTSSRGQLSPMEDKNLKSVIKLLRQLAGVDLKRKPPLVKEDADWLLKKAHEIFQKQPMLLEVTAPISICGDIHGQYTDLIRLYNQNGWPPKVRYLFLGDYVDRGPNNLETILLQFALKVRYPDNFYILRGNHETRSINRVYGFYDEVAARYDSATYEQFNDVFDWMPLSALVARRVLCMHGGISPDLTNFDQIREVKRPMMEVPDVGLVADILWADPEKNINGYHPSSRGISYQFGPDVVIDFCEHLDLDLVARAHQVVHEGFEFFADERLVTLFSAPDYCDQFTNAGGILSVEENLTCKIKQLPSKTAKAK